MKAWFEQFGLVEINLFEQLQPLLCYALLGMKRMEGRASRPTPALSTKAAVNPQASAVSPIVQMATARNAKLMAM